ncbi:MAG: MBL fold metallo-hydrolase, partial [Candidatus Heimdallarchaeaceae archaeon]
ENTFNTNYFLFITPSDPTLRNMKLKRSSEVFESTKVVVEEKSKWFKAEEISKQYYNLKKLFSPSITSFVEKIVKNYKKPFEAARELDQQIGIDPCHSYQYFPYTWRLSTPAPTLPPYNTTNIYIIGNENKYIIDPGSTEYEAINVIIQFIERNRDSMEGILLTNHYPDHCNQAQRLSETYDLPICTSKENARVLKEENYVFGSILKEGTKIPLGSYPALNKDEWYLETLELPGSSKGSIGFWDYRGLLFSGIALHKDLTTSNDSYPESYSEFLSSMEKMRKLKAKYAFSGHGRIITDVNKTLSMNMQSMKKIEKQLIEALKQDITEVDSLTDIITNTRKADWRFYMKRIVISSLEKLVDEGRANRIGADYIWSKKKIR